MSWTVAKLVVPPSMRAKSMTNKLNVDVICKKLSIGSATKSLEKIVSSSMTEDHKVSGEHPC